MCDANHFISKGHNPQIQDFPSSNIHVSEAKLWDSAQCHKQKEWCLCSRNPSAQTPNWMELLHYVIMMPQLRPLRSLSTETHANAACILYVSFLFSDGSLQFWRRKVVAESRKCILNLTFSIILYCIHVAYFKTTITFFPNYPSLWEQQTSLFKFIDESCCCSYLPHNLFCDAIQSFVELYWKLSIQSHM